MKSSKNFHRGIFVFVCLMLICMSQGNAVAQSGGQTLYNGITLPQQWPPAETINQDDIPPSYITNPQIGRAHV